MACKSVRSRLLWGVVLLSLTLCAGAEGSSVPASQATINTEALAKEAVALHLKGRLQEARRLDKQLLQLEVPNLDKDKRQHVGLLYNISSSLSATGELTSAIAFSERALALARTLGDAQTLAVMLYGTANLRFQLSDFSSARQAAEQALVIDEPRGGITVPSVLQLLGDIARNEGKGQVASQYYKKGLIHYQHKGQGECLGAAVAIHNCAVLELDDGNLPKATELCEKALSMKERAVGKEHPSTANSYALMGRILVRAGNAKSGETLIRAALSVHGKALGASSLAMAYDYSWLADALEAESDMPGAALARQQAAAIMRRAGVRGLPK